MQKKHAPPLVTPKRKSPYAPRARTFGACQHVTHVLNGSLSDGTLTAAIVEFATALGQRRLGSASAEDDATTRRLSMSSASVLSVSIGTFSPTPAPSPLPSMAPTPMPTLAYFIFPNEDNVRLVAGDELKVKLD